MPWVFAAFLIALWPLNTAPAFNLPLVPELLVVAGALAVVGLALRDGEARAALAARKPLLWLIGAWGLVNLGRAAVTVATENWELACGLMPGVVQKLECALQAGTDQQPVARLFSYDVAAFTTFVAGYVFSFSRRGRAVLGGVIGACAAFAVLTLWCRYADRAQFFPPWLVYNEHGVARMTSLMQNPTWIWPYCVPAIIASMWCFAYGKTPAKGLASCFLALAAAVLVLSQQRGAVLLIAALAATGIMIGGWRLIGRLRRPALVKGLRGVLIVGLPLAPVLLYVAAISLVKTWGANLGPIARLTQVDAVDDSRWKMAKVAWIGLRDHLFVGHGYGSWFNAFGSLVRAGHDALVLDTAHNYLVQSTFELGLPQVLLNVAVIAALAWAAIRRAAEPARALTIAVLTSVAYLAIAVSQEFNFVRSVYYTHALFAGWLLGNGFGGAPLSSRERSPPRFRSSPAFIAAAALAVAAAYFAAAFSLSGFQYEASAAKGYQPRVRWLRLIGSLGFVSIRPFERDTFALYSVAQTQSTFYDLGSETLPLRIDDGYESFIPVDTDLLLPTPEAIEFNAERALGYFEGRMQATLIAWPPVLSTLPIVIAKGLFPWERPSDRPDEAMRWCGAACELVLRKCSAGKRVLELVAARSDVAAATPLTITADDGSVRTFVFKADGERQELPLEPGKPLSLKASTTFTPPGDGRALGILLTGSFCRD